MPPKNEKKARAVEDKTFGLKNKNKSKSVQKYIKSVQQNAGINKQSEKNAQEKAAKKNAEKAMQQQALLLGLAGSLGEARKATKKKQPVSEKINLYEDQRDQQGDKGMEEWTQEKLEEVVNKKANKVTTDIICKHFLEAVEKRLYGWFWVCPNGGENCKYKHSLPPGFVLKSNVKKADDEEEEEEITIEEQIEIERKALPAGGIPVTLETLKAWKIRKEAERQTKMEEARKAEAKKSGGKGLNVMSGRDLFTFDPELFKDADGAASDYEEELDSDEEEQEDVEVKEIKEMVSELKVDPAVPIQEELFLAEGDIPDDLDNLDD